MCLIRNQSTFFIVCLIFDHMEYPWLQIVSSLIVLNITDRYSWLKIFLSLLVLNITDTTDTKWIEIFQKLVETF